ncbi:hypothetical protein BASA61_008913 [Batrachochytrium salamandrivorans]|nr:hypothetical protein BASA60_011265 [Batrachochytrium salamandrivorans]KAH6568510.1 hypothetical protein BASA62_005400 [Batrachochytrium salamandrivorans]KAH6581805.1 hypothetical protein BASA61_008913 [Batrachochytrium salamandrivorans]KAH9264900.1 hypothetical protein BASA83_011568 [Batrachochytrium salamandrivorans]KAJ1336516.1 hypothetical protein BSLG_007300 [Batrachochytrium salamandrivorans]
MLAQTLKEHQAQVRGSRGVDMAGVQTQLHIKTIVNDVSNANNARVSTAFLNERNIELDIKLLQAQLGVYQRQTKQWLALVDQLNSSLKSFGDLENWAGVIERDMQEITHTLAKGRSHLDNRYSCKCSVWEEVIRSLTSTITPAISSGGGSVTRSLKKGVSVQLRS